MGIFEIHKTIQKHQMCSIYYFHRQYFAKCGDGMTICNDRKSYNNKNWDILKCTEYGNFIVNIKWYWLWCNLWMDNKNYIVYSDWIVIEIDCSNQKQINCDFRHKADISRRISFYNKFFLKHLIS